MKCKYCENVATVKDYRTWDGQTGSERVCNDCFGITNNSLLDREAEVNKAKEEIFNSGLDDLAEGYLESGWGEMWDTINGEMFTRKEDMVDEFESQTGHEPHEDTVGKWESNILTIIDKLIKKSV
jgi:transcription initiation factor TFIIIB Brf1 subunit/transcription initiation factor TFIIB